MFIIFIFTLDFRVVFKIIVFLKTEKLKFVKRVFLISLKWGRNFNFRTSKNLYFKIIPIQPNCKPFSFEPNSLPLPNLNKQILPYTKY